MKHFPKFAHCDGCGEELTRNVNMWTTRGGTFCLGCVIMWLYSRA